MVTGNPTEIEKKVHKRWNVPFSDIAKENIKKQQGRYMKKHGQKIRLDHLAGILLETATYK